MFNKRYFVVIALFIFLLFTSGTCYAGTVLTPQNKDIFTSIVDMHYKTLRGVGYNPSEIGGEITKSITCAVYKGSTELTVDDTLGFCPNQLIAICAGGDYYSNVIKSINNNVVALYYPLSYDIIPGDTLHNFYLNPSHPNTYGYRVIADQSIRDLLQVSGHKLIKRILPSEWSGSALTNGGFKQDYTESFASFDTRVATCTGAGQGFIKQIELEQDTYLQIKANITVSDGTNAHFQITDYSDTEVCYEKYLTDLGNTYPENIILNVLLKKGKYNLKLLNDTIDGGIISLGKTEIYEISTKYDVNDFDKGIHLFLGDSWFENTTIQDRLKEWLPDATFVNFGVGGNRIDNLYRRFTGTATDADIKNDPINYGDRKDATKIPEIDYVWVLCGTNDYFNSTPSDNFHDILNDLVNKIIERNAKPIIFNSSVGQIGVGNNFTLSREYADIYYNQQYSFSDLLSEKLAYYTVVNFNDVVVPAGAEKIVGIYGLTSPTDNLTIMEAYFNQASGITLKVGQGSNIDALSENITTFTAKYNYSQILMAKPAANRFTLISINNSSGSSFTARGMVKIRKTQ